MTAKEHVLAIYPDAKENKRYRIARDATPEQFTIDIFIPSRKSDLITISTTFVPPNMIVDVAWEMAWKKIQDEMISKLESESEPDDEEQVRMWEFQEQQRWMERLERMEREMYNDLWNEQYGKS